MSRAMKDSGIKWIGFIPAEWKIHQIKNDFQIFSGATPKSEVVENWDGDIIWITPADYKTADKYVSQGKRNISKVGYNSCGTTFVPSGSIIFSKRAPIGTVAITAAELCTNQGCLSCVPKADTSSSYYYYVLSAFTEQFNLFGTGTTFKEISYNDFRSFKVPFPPLEEQQRIASFLDDKCARIDNVIEKTRASIVEYKKLKQAIITRAVTKGMRPARPMKDSGIDWLGDIPADWEICKLKYFLSADKVNLRVGPFGSALSGTDFTSEGFWVYNQRIVLDNNFSENNTFVSKEKYEELKGFEVLPGDVLITTRGSIGKVAIVPSTAEKGILHPCITKFIVNEDLISHSLIWHIFNNTDIAMRQIKNMSNSTTIEVLYSYSLKNIQIPLIPKDEQKEIAQYLDEKTAAIDSLIARKNQLVTELESLKKSLIFEYVTGKREII